MKLEQIDWDALWRGTIPWAVDDCIDCTTFNIFSKKKEGN